MMLQAMTLVHKAGMDIALHSIRTFALHFSKTHTLTIHTDPSVDQDDQRLLLDAAQGIQAKITTANERWNKIDKKLGDFPRTKEFLNRTSYFAKLEIPMVEEVPYFFFDSDVIWLRPVNNLEPANAPNAFSTESWSWYSGISKPKLWIQGKTPRRVNSGFHYISQKFPYQKMENLLSQGMFNKNFLYAGDQEIFAYLYNEMEYYHPQDMKRSRVGSIYQLNEEPCAALHFAGKMWLQHLDQISLLPDSINKLPMQIRYQPSVPLSHSELIRMRIQMKLGESVLLAKPLNLIRKLGRNYR